MPNKFDVCLSNELRKSVFNLPSEESRTIIAENTLFTIKSTQYSSVSLESVKKYIESADDTVLLVFTYNQDFVKRVVTGCFRININEDFKNLIYKDPRWIGDKGNKKSLRRFNALVEFPHICSHYKTDIRKEYPEFGSEIYSKYKDLLIDELVS